MCSPIFAVAALVGGTILQARGEKSAAEAQVRAHNTNAQTAAYQSADRQEAGEIEVEKSYQMYRRHRGASRASAASGGGSQLSFQDVLADDSAEAAVERMTIRYSADKDSFYLRRQMDAEVQSAGDARRAGGYAVAGAFVGGAYSASKQFMSYGGTGGTGGGGGGSVGSASSVNSVSVSSPFATS